MFDYLFIRESGLSRGHRYTFTTDRHLATPHKHVSQGIDSV